MSYHLISCQGVKDLNLEDESELTLTTTCSVVTMVRGSVVAVDRRVESVITSMTLDFTGMGVIMLLK